MRTNLSQLRPPRLASLAARREEAVIDTVERLTREGSAARKIWLVSGVLGLLLCTANVASVISGENDWVHWQQAILQGALGILSLSMAPMWRRQVRLVRR